MDCITQRPDTSDTPRDRYLSDLRSMQGQFTTTIESPAPLIDPNHQMPLPLILPHWENSANDIRRITEVLSFVIELIKGGRETRRAPDPGFSVNSLTLDYIVTLLGISKIPKDDPFQNNTAFWESTLLSTALSAASAATKQVPHTVAGWARILSQTTVGCKRVHCICLEPVDNEVPVLFEFEEIGPDEQQPMFCMWVQSQPDKTWLVYFQLAHEVGRTTH